MTAADDSELTRLVARQWARCSVIVGAAGRLDRAYELAKRGATSTVFETDTVVRPTQAARREQPWRQHPAALQAFSRTFGALDQMSHYELVS